MNEQSNASDGQAKLVRTRIHPAASLGLYALLVTSVALSLWGAKLGAPSSLQASAPWLFLFFAIGFSAYRFTLVAAGRYSAFRAFLQVGFSAVFFVVLYSRVPATHVDLGGQQTTLEELLHDSSPRVRSLAAELARYRPEGRKVCRVLAESLSDEDEQVRTEVHTTLVRLNNGRDLGLPNGVDAVQIWMKNCPQ